VAGMLLFGEGFQALGFIHATISISLDSTTCPILKFKIENEFKH
jgi:hypothetical protein